MDETLKAFVETEREVISDIAKISTTITNSTCSE